MPSFLASKRAPQSQGAIIRFHRPRSGERREFLKKSISLSAAAGLIAMVPPGARNSAWAGNTDNLNRSVPGALDGAHMLAGMPISATLKERLASGSAAL
jgi:hypothetical protein